MNVKLKVDKNPRINELCREDPKFYLENIRINNLLYGQVLEIDMSQLEEMRKMECLKIVEDGKWRLREGNVQKQQEWAVVVVLY